MISIQRTNERRIAKRGLSLTALATAVALLFSAAFAQQLPANAQQAIERGERLMAEALSTYGAQYPDRPLWQQAFAEGRSAVSLAPGHPAPLRFLAEAYSRANWPGPAARTWEEYVAAGGTIDDEVVDLYVAAANANAYAAYQRGELEQAAELYANVTRNVPTNLEAHRWLGRILLELDRPEQAVAVWRTYTELDPDDQGAQYFLDLAQAQSRWGTQAANAFFQGVGAYEAGDLVQARLSFANATARNAEYAEAWAWLGRVAFEQGFFDDAYTAYGRAADLAPDNSTYAYFRQESQRRMSGDDGATTDTDAATEDTGTDGENDE